MGELLRLEHVSKIYRKRKKKLFEKTEPFYAVKDVSFSVNKGEIFGLVGESGSGKTTLVKMILGLASISEGKIFYKNRDITHLTKEEQQKWHLQAQMVFQNPYSSLNPSKKVGWSIMEGLIINDIGTHEERVEKVKKILQDVEMEPSVMDQYPRELSGGQRQRVAIASALVLEPTLVLIDEGVSALDVSVQAQVLNLIRELQERLEFTAIFISHDLNVIEYLCDRIAVMQNGELKDLFLAEELYEEGRAPYTVELFDSVKDYVDFQI